jgi:hypothetical protein
MDAHSHAGLSEGGLPGDDDVNERTDPATPRVLAIDARTRPAAVWVGGQRVDLDAKAFIRR